MTQAVLFFDGACFAGIAFAGEEAYERNVERTEDFITPVVLDGGVDPNDVLHLLNSGEKRILKTGVNILVNDVAIEHKRLSKR